MVYTLNANLESLRQEVDEAKTVQASAVTLLNGIVARLDELASQLAEQEIDNTAVLSMRDELHASTDALAAAVANVPPPSG